MARSESHSITVSRRGSAPDDEDAAYTVIWVRGEHDLATKVSLVVAIARAAQRDEADVLVDLSEVTFMDASTVDALVRSRNRLRPRLQSLQLRAPSPPALRVLEMCGLSDFVHHARDAVHPMGRAAALSTWVDVPAAESIPEVADETVPAGQPHLAQVPVPAVNARLSGASSTVEVDRGRP